MAFIKNQILKRLSRLTKNLSPDKLKLSALKGEGTLTNLELNEEVLMETLDVPTWLRITKATCNSMSIKISWTRLKTKPVVIHLDRVEVEIETCNEPRDPARSNALNIPSRPPNTKYGLADRIVDGITIEIDTVAITFRSLAFVAVIELNRLRCASCTPTWAATSDLKCTQIRNAATGEILVFKEIEWETTRLEAHAVFTAPADNGSVAQRVNVTPLRLIANMSRIRLAIKKRSADNVIVASRMQVLLNDLLWVLTLSQLEAAIVFVRHLLQAVSKSQEQQRRLRRDELLLLAQTSRAPSPGVNANNASANAGKSANASQAAVSALFDKFDVAETSYHLYVKNVDLHLCEEGQADKRLSSNAVQGGAIQITLHKLALDLYPYHKPNGSRRTWLGVNADLVKRMRWNEQLLEQFWLERSQLAHGEALVEKQRDALHELCFLLRLKRVQIRTVSTPTPKTRRKPPPRDLLATDSAMQIPEDLFSVYLEYGDHYYMPAPNDAFLLDTPVPPPNVYLTMYPIRLTIDHPTVVWLNAFATRLTTHLADLIDRITLLEKACENNGPSHTAPQPDVMHVRLELLLPTLVLPAPAPVCGQPERPQALQIRVPSILLTNTVLSEPTCGGEVQRLKSPLDRCTSIRELRDTRQDLESNITDLDADSEQTQLFSDANIEQLAKAAQFWFVHVDRLWVEYLGAQCSHGKPQPCLNELTLHVAILNDDKQKQARLGVSVDCAHTKFVHLELNHYQYLFLCRTVESLQKLAGMILEDRNEIIQCQATDVRTSAPDALMPNVYLLASPRCAFVVTCVMPALAEHHSLLRSSRTFSHSVSAELPGQQIAQTQTQTQTQTQPIVEDEVFPSHLSNGDRHELSFSQMLQQKACDDGLHSSPSANSSVHSAAGLPNVQSSPAALSAASFDALRSRGASDATSKSPLAMPAGTGSPSLTMRKTFTKISTGFAKLGDKLKAQQPAVNGLKQAAGLRTVGSNDSLSTEDDADVRSTSGLSELSESDEEDQSDLLDLLNNGASLFDDTSIGIDASVCNAEEVLTEQSDDVDVGSMCTTSSVTERGHGHSGETVSLVSLLLGAPRLVLRFSTVGTSPRLQAHVQCESLALREFGNRLVSATDSVVQLVDIAVDDTLAERNSSKPRKCIYATLALSGEQCHAELHIDSVHLSVLNSSLDNLRDLFEDEFLPPVAFGGFPIRICVTDLHLRMKDDRPSNNLTSPGSVPVNVHIPSLTVEIDAAGVVRINAIDQKPLAAESATLARLDAGTCTDDDCSLLTTSPNDACQSGAVPDATFDATANSSVSHATGVSPNITHLYREVYELKTQLGAAQLAQVENGHLKQQVTTLASENQRLKSESEQLICVINKLQEELKNAHYQIECAPVVRRTSESQSRPQPAQPHPAAGTGAGLASTSPNNPASLTMPGMFNYDSERQRPPPPPRRAVQPRPVTNN